MATRTRRRSGQAGTKRVWSSIVGAGNILPGGIETVDLVPPQWRPDGDEEKQDITLLRIRGVVAIQNSDASFPSLGLGTNRLEASANCAIWALPTHGTDATDANDVADQGLVWLDNLGFSAVTVVETFGPSPPDSRTPVFIGSGLRAKETIDVKAMRYFKRFRPSSDPLEDLIYECNRFGDEGSGSGFPNVRHFLSVRMLWLVR